MLPAEVLSRAGDEMLDWRGSGMGVMEMSHRGKEFISIYEEAERDLRELLVVPAGYRILFLQGGATLQFAQIPMNLLRGKAKADYVNTGEWSKKAIKEAKAYCDVHVAASSEDRSFSYAPKQWDVRPDTAYVHYCSNETIGGVEYHSIPKVEVPLVADASSHFLSRPLDVAKFGLIYAGAQKNAGPAGLTFVIVRDDLIGQVAKGTPSVMDYSSGFFKSVVAKEDRSRMNVPFKLADEKLDGEFLKGAEKQGMVQLKGHRSVGGMRASIYNAMSIEGVQQLVSYMKDFEKKHG
jgi:phosphoserine aminotransferase